MVSIKASRQVSAKIDSVWEIVSDVDNEPRYWHGTKTVSNISRHDNVIEREVTIAFKDSRCRQTVVLSPKSSVEITITEGPMKGKKIIALSSVAGDKTMIEVTWDIKLGGFMAMFTGVVKKHIAQGTEEALERIAKALE